MKKAGKVSTRELGLDLTLIIARYLLHTDHLHYGYWSDGLEPDISNVKEAQERYADLLVSQIPAGIRTILDVGCGTGAMAQRLKSEGYEVDCVSPSPYLTERVRTLLGKEHVIFECKFEELETDKKYDLILFSESFQYVPLGKSLPMILQHLNPGGHLLISDFFRKETPEPGPFGGGHHLKNFYERVANTNLQILSDRDITPETAPNLDIVVDFNREVLIPIKNRVFYYLESAHKPLFWMIQRIFRKKLAQMDEKYMKGKRTGKEFQVYKTYRLMLLKDGKLPVAPLASEAKETVGVG